MTENQEKDIILMSAIVANLKLEERFKDWSPGKEFNDAVEDIVKAVERVNSEFRKKLNGGLEEKSHNRLRKKVEAGEYFYAVFRNEEIIQLQKKNLKTRIKVDKESFLTICEHSMAYCENCKRNKKVCSLRKAFLKTEVDTPGREDTKKCEYYIEGED